MFSNIKYLNRVINNKKTVCKKFFKSFTLVKQLTFNYLLIKQLLISQKKFKNKTIMRRDQTLNNDKTSYST